MPFSIIVACGKNWGIGINGKLPWKNEEDMKFFRNTTLNTMDENKRNAIIMGRKTFESLNCRPLPGRINICLTSQASTLQYPHIKNVFFFDCLEKALEFTYNRSDIEKTFIIGGGSLYEEAIKHNECNELFINEINVDTPCDTFFPEIDNSYKLVYQTKLSDEVVCYKFIR